jgi:hypothetical protein
MALALFLLVFYNQRALAQADNCASAGVVTCGTSLTGQTNVGATNDAFPTCNTSGILATGAPNVWYSFVGTGQTVTVSTCANTNFDSEIGIFSGSCGSLVCVAGNDNDACGTSDETVTFNSFAGTNYFIMVQGHAGSTGTFTLDVTCAAPPADPCAAPIETIACASSNSVSLTGSGAGWNVTACGFSTPGAEKVYSFTATVTGVHTLQVTAANGTFIDYFFKDASGGCSSTGWTCIDDVSSAPTSTNFGPLTAGTTYLILLDDENTSSSTATFQINCPSPPVDPCAAPIETIACASSKTATLSGSGAGWSPNSCGFSTPGAEKVYSFTPTVTGTHTLQVTAADGTFIDYFFKAASGGCSSTGWTCIDDVGSATSVTFGPLTAGTTYLILLDDESTVSSTQTFQINCPAPPDPCAAPIETIACASSKTVTLSGNGASWNPTSCGFSTPGAEKVYSFTPAITGNHTLQVTAADGTFIDYFFKDASGGCSSTGWTCIDDISSATSVTFGPLTAGTTYLILLDDESTVLSTQTFQINCPNPPVVLTCPTNTTAAACQTQAAINTAFAAWLSTATASGGCNGVLTNDNTGAPSACGGSTTVTFTYTSTCAPTTTTCQATFTVAAAPTVLLTCPTNTTSPIGQTQAQVNADFAAWLATATASGGCNGVLTNNNTGAPPASGGSTTVTFNYTSDCAPLTTTCQATFTVSSAPPVILTCPTNTTAAACQTQAAINTAFVTWLATATASGGCNGVLTNNNTGAPSACGGSTTVTFTYTSTCAPLTTTCQATFTVAAPPTVVLTCPTNTTAAACQTQAAVNTAFAAWLATASASGGCNGVLTNNNTGAPSACGGSTTVTFTYTSSCAPLTTTCQATFTVAAAPTVVLTCPTPTTASACLTQAQLDAAYAAWLATASASGGCNGVLTNNGGTAPSICSATAVTRTVTFTYTSTCAPLTTTCTSTFTVPAYPSYNVPANGASQVACPAAIVQPTPPTVVDGCGQTLMPTGPTITNIPNPITCEGTRTYTWTYTDCAGLVRTWNHVITVERNPFTVPANGAATVACPANATQPTPPTVTSNCGEVLTPTGPTITNAPNPLTCEGTRTYAWVYTDCEGNTATWSFVYTIERQPFTVPANGGATVACPAQTDAQPTPPVVTSNCGEVLTPVVSASAKPLCEGTRTYTFTYTDCEGNTADWRYVYTVEYNDFTVPASVVNSVECPVNAVTPTPPSVTDNCGNVLVPVGPTLTSANNAQGCEGSRVYSYVYTDCEGNSHTWSTTYNFLYTADFFAPADEENYVTCLSYAVPPVPQALTDFCGQAIKVSGPTVEESIATGGCTGWRKYSYVYTDCGGHSHPWSFTYYINDNEGPLGTCQNSGPVSINVSNLGCVEDVPCPDDYDFSQKIQELLVNGNYYDVCDGANISVALDSWSDLWECSDPDGTGVYTFGRTFYFRIADACGNEAASLCEVTYSGACLPIESFVQGDWGIPGGEPGNSSGNNVTDLQLITALLDNNPVVIGGAQRSLTISDAQCIVNLLPGTGGPGRLGNCHQVNCTGCNPLGIGGMKNTLAANTIALILNMRYNVQYNGLSMNQLRGQGLGCIEVDDDIVACTGTSCVLRIFDQAGVKYDFPYTLGGLLDLSNHFLGGNVSLSKGQASLYGKAINISLANANAYWSRFHAQSFGCDNSELRSNGGSDRAQVTTGGEVAKQGTWFSLAPNPAGHEVNLMMTEELEEAKAVVIELYNSLGQLVLRKDFGVTTFIVERIDLSGVRNGLYVVSIRVGNERFDQKLVVSKD